MSVKHAFGFDCTDEDWALYNNGVLSPKWPLRPDYLVFTIVRNPFDRLISAWHYLKATRERPLLDVLSNPPESGHDFRHLTRPQTAILYDQSKGALVADAVIRFEDCQTGFDSVCDLIGKPRCKLPHINATERERDYRGYFDQQTRAMAEAMFKDDLALLGYSF